MKKMTIAFCCCMLFISDFVQACSAVVLKDGTKVYLAKNFDWTFRDGMLIKNPRGVEKIAYFTHTGTQARWTSKYGSVTFNQNGKEMPYGGMNEKGLVVEMLWMDFSRYNIGEERAYVNELEWIQYQLDNYASVKEVVGQLDELKVYPIKAKIHYILTDASGESVIIEYLNGKAVAYKKEANTCQAITNNSVTQSEPYKNQIQGIRKTTTAPSYRYYLLEQEIGALSGNKEVNASLAFDMLRKVTIPQGDFKTMWSIVYDVQQKRISFFTDAQKEIRSIDVSSLDFSKDLQYADLNAVQPLKLDVLTVAVNQQYVGASLMHLGFEEAVTKDIAQHQYSMKAAASSVFSEQYFHFEISAPLEEERQTGFLAVMDSENNFQERKAVAGGYLYGNIAKGTMVFHIYGLKNGRYALLSFIDQNKNRKLDFSRDGTALEKYASFSDQTFSKASDLNFASTSADFSRANARVTINWKQ